ncbi:MAG TPA: aminotransferase class V-fold PLP-dependent enzyme [Cyclobacteriaceae bacterium]|nr:aminotransferase class V-fold PLP-dependent enzyme [Cyclobacteriaceae bacterium]
MNYPRRTFLKKTGAASALAIFTDPINSLSASNKITAEDPLGVRGDFPIAQMRTYLNAAYTAAIPRQVVDAAYAFANGKAQLPSTVGSMLKDTEKVRQQYALLINALPEEIAFLASTSEGENIVANGIPWNAGDNVVTDDLHYETGFVIYRHLEKSKGIQVRIVKNKDGGIAPEDYAKVVDKRTRLLALSFVSSLNGFRHDLRALANLAHANGAYIYVDGIQGVGAFPFDAHSSGIDFMCSGTYKWLLASYGVAPFYIRKELIEVIPLDRFGWKHVEKELPDGQFELSHAAKRFEYATLPFGVIAQLGAALTYLEKVGVEKIGTHTLGLARTIRKEINDQGKRLFTPLNNESPTVTCYIENPAAALTAFSAATIDVTVREKEKQVRVSPALFNTIDEVGKFLEVLKKLR